MGQKTNPIGLRVGLWQRKWNNTWYTSTAKVTNLFFSQQKLTEILRNFFYSYSLTKKKQISRALLVNTKLIKSSINVGYWFIFFYKLRKIQLKRMRRLKKRKIKVLWKKKTNYLKKRTKFLKLAVKK